MANERDPKGPDALPATLRVEYTTYEGDFDIEGSFDDCLNRCPRCGGVSGSGSSGSGSTSGSGDPGDPPLTFPPDAWLLGFQTFYCTGGTPYPPGTGPLFPPPAWQPADVCAAVACILGGGDCTLYQLLIELYLIPVWITMGSPATWPGTDVGGGPGGAGGIGGFNLLVEFTEYDVPADVKIIAVECVDEDFCTCPHDGSGSGDVIIDGDPGGPFGDHDTDMDAPATGPLDPGGGDLT